MRAMQIVKTTFGGAVLLAGLVLATAPAEAGHKHKQKHKHHDGCGHGQASRHHDDEHYDGGGYDGYQGHHGDYDHGDYDRPRYRRAQRVYIPEEIVFGEVGRYRPYYERRAYYAPHRHDHVFYTFPVHTPHGVVQQRHAYCRGPRGFVAFQGPRFGFQVGF